MLHWTKSSFNPAHSTLVMMIIMEIKLATHLRSSKGVIKPRKTRLKIIERTERRKMLLSTVTLEANVARALSLDTGKAYKEMKRLENKGEEGMPIGNGYD
nr:hypothetical protein [Tanacetum cinerariifolium]